MHFLDRHKFPSESAELDKLFKESGCTLTGAGYQDGMCADLILTLAANANNLRYDTIRTYWIFKGSTINDHGAAGKIENRFIFFILEKAHQANHVNFASYPLVFHSKSPRLLREFSASYM